MLVLSRRPGERILFPSLGISIEVLRSRGAVVRLGIEAPHDVKVIRGEIAGDDHHEERPPNALEAMASQRRHELRNQLNQVTLKLELLRCQLELGQAPSPDAVLDDAIVNLARIEDMIGDKSARPEELSGVRVLIVEDQAEERELMANCLQLSGLDVASAGDGAKALEYLHSHQPPDLVLLDMRMPGIDGPTLLDEIRKDERLDGIRIFAVSGSARSEYPAAAMAVDGWFSKPVRIDALLHAAKLTRNAAHA